MKTCLSLLTALPLLILPVTASSQEVDEKAYTRLAAQVIATVDACAALEIIDPQIGMLDEIEVAMLSFGAQPEEVEEWQSNVIANFSESFQAILKAEDENAAWLTCTKGIEEKRGQLAAIWNGEDPTEIPDDSQNNNGNN
jgi:hypothetical protein